MDYYHLMYIHLATVVPCVFIGAYLLARPKGSKIHRKLGMIYMSLMMFTALITLFMPNVVGPSFLGHFGYIHLFSFLTIYTVPTALIAIRKKQVKKHQRKMWLLSVGAHLLTFDSSCNDACHWDSA